MKTQHVEWQHILYCALQPDSTSQLIAQAVPQKTLQLLYKSSRNTENMITQSKQKNDNEPVYFYVFGTEDNKGFVIVSGDDRVSPVLGYSYTNSFSAENMPDNVTWWLGQYAKQIEYAIENNIEPTQEVKLQWENYLQDVENNKE